MFRDHTHTLRWIKKSNCISEIKKKIVDDKYPSLKIG
jgi:hypothetical protein